MATQVQSNIRRPSGGADRSVARSVVDGERLGILPRWRTSGLRPSRVSLEATLPVPVAHVWLETQVRGYVHKDKHTGRYALWCDVPNSVSVNAGGAR
jgi:hypothetical protein